MKSCLRVPLVLCSIAAMSIASTAWAGPPVEAEKPERVSSAPEFGLCVGGVITKVVDGDSLKFTPDSIAIDVRLVDCWSEESLGELSKRTAAGAASAAHLRKLAEGQRGRLWIPTARKLGDVLTLNRVAGRVWKEGLEPDLSTIQVRAGHARRTKPTKKAVSMQGERVPDWPQLFFSNAETIASADRPCGCVDCKCIDCTCDVATKEPDGIELLNH